MIDPLELIALEGRPHLTVVARRETAPGRPPYGGARPLGAGKAAGRIVTEGQAVIDAHWEPGRTERAREERPPGQFAGVDEGSFGDLMLLSSGFAPLAIMPDWLRNIFTPTA